MTARAEGKTRVKDDLHATIHRGLMPARGDPQARADLDRIKLRLRELDPVLVIDPAYRMNSGNLASHASGRIGQHLQGILRRVEKRREQAGLAQAAE